MKNYIIIIFIILLPGCSVQSEKLPLWYQPVNINTSTLHYELIEENGWRIIQPPEGQWRTRNGATYDGPPPSSMNYLPKYFPDRSDDGTGGQDYNNFFYAVFDLYNNKKLALWIHIINTFEIKRRNYLNFFGKKLAREDYYYDPYNKCLHSLTTGLIIMFNPIDVIFNSSKVNIIYNNTYINMTEIINSPGPLKDNIMIESSIYNLIDPSEVDIKKRSVLGRNRPRGERELLYEYSLYRYQSEKYKYSTFMYRFSISCRDMENAILVIDGLTYEGKLLPPLKVRMKYYDFDRVPEYTGPAAKESISAE